MLRPANGANETRRAAARRNTGRFRLAEVDRGLAFTFLLLLMLGLLTLYAASYYNAQDKGSAFSEVASQLMGVAVGMVGMLLILHIDYRWLAKPWICGGLLAASFIMLILASAGILLQRPFFCNAVSTVAPQVLSSPKGATLLITAVVLIIAILLPGLFFSPLMDDGAGSASMNILFYAGLVIAIIGIAMFLLYLVRKYQKSFLVGSCIMAVAGGLLAIVAKSPMYQDNGFWTAIGMNSIAYWTIGCTLISLCITSTVFVFLKAKDGLTFHNYGVTFRPSAIICGLCTAVATVVLSYAVLFLMDALFKADFRIWTFAFKTFDFNIIPAILRYLPTFLAFYLVSTVGIAINTNTAGTQGFKGYLLAIALNAGGAILWLARQYITLFSTGVAAHPGSALSGIMLVAMVPTLSIAAVISRNLFKKTGNIWTPAFLNALLMTTMAIANTMVVFK